MQDGSELHVAGQRCQFLFRIPLPGFLPQDSSSRLPPPGFLLQDSSSRIPQDSSPRIPLPGFLPQDSSSRISLPGFIHAPSSSWSPLVAVRVFALGSFGIQNTFTMFLLFLPCILMANASVTPLLGSRFLPQNTFKK